MKKKLTIDDPKFFNIIGKLGGDARKAGGADFSALAASSHPREFYNGGRPKGSKNKVPKISAVKKAASVKGKNVRNKPSITPYR